MPIDECVPVAQPQTENLFSLGDRLGCAGTVQHVHPAERADAAPHAEESHVIPQGGMPLEPVEPIAIRGRVDAHQMNVGPEQRQFPAGVEGRERL